VEACRRAADHCKAKGYPIEKLAMQYACSNPRIASTVFSTTRPDAIRQNIAYIEEPIDEQLVKEVREIIGEQQRVSWENT
jgi:aryl-alcohol dehydrogenase-like predicted oxidoreductase